MKNWLIKNKANIFFITIILFFSMAARILKTHDIPPNITGDEVTNLTDVYQVMVKDGNFLFNFMGDGSVAGINFYWVLLWIKIFGIDNAIVASRISVGILSSLALIPFYFLLKERTSDIHSFILSLLLSANYVFLNFSRTLWVNMGIIFSGLFLILFLEKATKEGRILWYVLAGIFAGITLYGYHYGKILVISIVLFYILKIIKNPQKSEVVKVFSFFSVAVFVFLPFLINIINNHAEALLLRPKSVFILTQNQLQESSKISTLIENAISVGRGLILLDGSLLSNGIENKRYVPLYTSPVNIVVKILFILGFLYTIFYIRKLWLWWIIGISVIVTQILTENPPNFSRAIFYIPFIYFIVGIFTYNISLYAKRMILSKIMWNISVILLFFLTLILLTFDLTTYFRWMQTQELRNARQPALEYKEFLNWQAYQIQRIKDDKIPISVYDWRIIKLKNKLNF